MRRTWPAGSGEAAVMLASVDPRWRWFADLRKQDWWLVTRVNVIGHFADRLQTADQDGVAPLFARFRVL